MLIKYLLSRLEVQISILLSLVIYFTLIVSGV